MQSADGLATSSRPGEGLPNLAGVSCGMRGTTGNAGIFSEPVPQPFPSSDEEEAPTPSIPGFESGLSARWMEDGFDAFAEEAPVHVLSEVSVSTDAAFDSLLTQLHSLDADVPVSEAPADAKPAVKSSVTITGIASTATVIVAGPQGVQSTNCESGSFDRLMDDSLRRVRQRTLPACPWDRGPVSWILGNSSVDDLWQGLGNVQHLAVSGFVPERPAPPVDVVKNDIPRVFWSAVRSRTAGLDFPAQQDAERRIALIRWKLIIYEAMEHCSAGTLLAQSVMAGEEATQCFLEDLFAGKATSTMNKRASSALRFLKWSTGRGLVCWPLQEVVVYSYLAWLKTEGAPTTGQAFVEALRFSHGVIGLYGVLSVLESRRIVGSARLMMEKKAPPRQRDPLTVEQIRVLERLSATAETLQDRVMSGALRFMVHARLRASDMARASKLEFDLVHQGGCRSQGHGHKNGQHF